MTAPTEFELTPDEVLDYGWDCSDWLETGDTVAGVTISAEAGVTVASPGHDDTTVSALFSGITIGDRKRVDNLITTANGFTASRSFILVGVPYKWG